VAGGFETVTAPDVPVIVPLEAVIFWLPAVPKVIENVPVPFISTEPAGSFAELSVLENFTVPE
jgi:hypothetical protein